MPKLIHAMIRVVDLARSMAFYGQGFGLVESHRLDFPTFTLVYLREPESGFEIELTLNKGHAEPYMQ
jgi:lactoylglutathione lyase